MKGNLLKSVIFIAIVLAALYLVKGKDPSMPVFETTGTNKEQQTEVLSPNAQIHKADKPFAASPNGTPLTQEDSDEIILNTGNFEGFVLKCFAGNPCKLGEDPFKMYQEFKGANNRKANDSLISYMRSQLKNKFFRDQYKDLLKRMIDDFYPREEKQFQEAAYYNYLGDLQKSLETYLDLQKKSQTDPTLRPAPNFNIANTLYDMHKFKAALPYYEAALQESLSLRNKPTPNSESFIEERIAEIKSKLSL